MYGPGRETSHDGGNDRIYVRGSGNAEERGRTGASGRRSDGNVGDVRRRVDIIDRQVDSTRSEYYGDARGSGYSGYDQRASEEKVEKARRAFLQRWKLDGRAAEFMSTKAEDIQWYVMDHYRPREYTAQDRLSPLFMNYVKEVCDNWESIRQDLAAASGHREAEDYGRRRDEIRTGHKQRDGREEDRHGTERDGKRGFEGRKRGLAFPERPEPRVDLHERSEVLAERERQLQRDPPELDPARQDIVKRFIRKRGLNRECAKLLECSSMRTQDAAMKYFDKDNSDINEAFMRFFDSRFRNEAHHSHEAIRGARSTPRASTQPTEGYFHPRFRTDPPRTQDGIKRSAQGSGRTSLPKKPRY